MPGFAGLGRRGGRGRRSSFHFDPAVPHYRRKVNAVFGHLLEAAAETAPPDGADEAYGAAMTADQQA